MASTYHVPSDMFVVLVSMDAGMATVEHPYMGRIVVPATELKIGRYL